MESLAAQLNETRRELCLLRGKSIDFEFIARITNYLYEQMPTSFPLLYARSSSHRSSFHFNVTTFRKNQSSQCAHPQSGEETRSNKIVITLYFIHKCKCLVHFSISFPTLVSERIWNSFIHLFYFLSHSVSLSLFSHFLTRSRIKKPCVRRWQQLASLSHDSPHLRNLSILDENIFFPSS